MRVCPKCGHIDRSQWRQNRWRTNVEFLKYQDYPEDLDARVLKKLQNGHAVTVDKLYAYRFSGGVVERVLKVDYDVGGMSAFHIPRQYINHKRDLFQTKLAVKEK